MGISGDAELVMIAATGKRKNRSTEAIAPERSPTFRI